MALGDNLFKDKNDLSPLMESEKDETGAAKPKEVADEFYSTNGVILRVPANTAVELGKKNEKVNRDHNTAPDTNDQIIQKRNAEVEPAAFYRSTITWTLEPQI